MSILANTFDVLEKKMFQYWDNEIPCRYDNLENRFQQPEKESWVHFSVQFGASVNTSRCGSKTKRRRAGTLQLYIFVPAHSGKFKSLEIADKFDELFVNQTIEHITTETSFISQPVEVSNWYENRISIPFYFYDT